MNKDLKTKGAGLPPLELKHLIWILDWALEKCAKEIESMEVEYVRHQKMVETQANARTKWGLKDRAKRSYEISDRLAEYTLIYDWMIGAKAQAMTKSHEEFARDIADYFKAQRGKL
jgi:hypothetical protein